MPARSPDPEGLVTFEAGGEVYTAVFGFRAMKAVETHWDLPFFRAIQQIMPGLSTADLADKTKVREASAEVRFTDMGDLFRFSLLKHHPDLTEDEADDLIDEIGGLGAAGEIIGKALAAAIVEADDGSAAHPPRKARPKPARRRK